MVDGQVRPWTRTTLPRTKFGRIDERAFLDEQIAIRKAMRREALLGDPLFKSNVQVVLLVRELRAADPFAGAHADPEIMDRTNDRRRNFRLVAIAAGAIDDETGVGVVLCLLLRLGNEPGIPH